MAEKKFGDRTFRSTHMLATEALVLQARLLKAVGPGLPRLGEVFGGFGKNATEEAKSKASAAAIDAFGAVFASGDPEAFAVLVRDIVSKADIKRPSGSYEPADLDGDFSGPDMKDLLPVAVWVLREQFGDFFSGLQVNGARGIPARA